MVKRKRKTARNQRVVLARLDGHTIRGIAKRFRITHVRVLQILAAEHQRHQLRDEPAFQDA